MAPIPVPPSKSLAAMADAFRPFHFFLVVFLMIANAVPGFAGAPPTAENAYCGKGNVAQFGTKDGPAELPKSCFYTALDGTPSPGKQIRVSAKGDLTEAFEHAKCGDTLLLAAGATFELKDLPAKKCDDQHYVTVRTDTPDDKLPPEGTRISPAWAGVASLPGRPGYAQSAGGAAKLLATIVLRRPAGVAPGDHVRFIGIEWTTPAEEDISRMITGEHSDHIIFDRNWFHPAEGKEVAHAVGMSEGAHMIAVINSYISGLNCIARTGKCTDATGIGGGKGDEQISTIKIYNNFIESAGENILFGGSAATQVPTDIEIRRNHLFRPMQWKEGEPGYTPAASGESFIVKNNLELKSAIRVLVEANLLENTWGGFSQTGYSILLTPKSQGGQCPICRVNDVTIRFNRIRNVAGVLQIANAPASKTGGFSADGGRYSIHDIFADDLHDKDYKGGGSFLILVSWQPPLHDIVIDHVTAFVSGKLFSVLNPGAKLANITITNSVFSIGADRAVTSAGGGPESCAGRTRSQGAEAIIQACFDPYKFEKNLIISAHESFPKGNFVVGSAEAAGIRDLKGSIGKDPKLCTAKGSGCGKVSPGIGAASDGKDLGADIDAVTAAIAGVE